MDPLAWLLIIPILVLLGLSAFFSSTETAFACLNKYSFIVRADKGDKKAKAVVLLYEKFDKTLVSVLIGYNVCSIVISTISTILFMSLLGDYLDNEIVSLLSSILCAILAFIFGDSIPKVIAKHSPEKVAENNVTLMTCFIYIFYPLTLTFSFIAKKVKKLMKTTPPPELTEEDFTNVVEAIEAKGDLEGNESDIIQASFDFTETTVKEVLTPLNKMLMINAENLTRAKLIETVINSPYSRIPVYYHDENNIVGILIVKKYLNDILEDSRASFKKSLQKPYIVSPKVTMDDLLEGFKNHHTQIAIVKNNGVVVGMVTSEDVLEELVGRINEKASEEGEQQ